jgi:hypothetical protein
VCISLCLCTGRGLATSWSPVQGLLTVLDLVTEVKRKVPWRWPRPELGCRAKGKKKPFQYKIECIFSLYYLIILLPFMSFLLFFINKIATDLSFRMKRRRIKCQYVLLHHSVPQITSWSILETPKCDYVSEKYFVKIHRVWLNVSYLNLNSISWGWHLTVSHLVCLCLT